MGESAAAAPAPEPVTRARPEVVRRLSLGLAITLTLLVGLSAPNAARPDLRGSWPWEGLIRLALSPAAVTGVLWISIALGLVGVVLGLRLRPGPLRWWLPLTVGGLSLLSAPFGSGDHLNYAAYGRILLQGGDPWVASPIDWAGGADPITSAVEEPWTTEPSVYGPFATLLHGLAAAVGGEHLRLVVLIWQVVVVLAWLGVRWGLRAILPSRAHGRVDVLWTLNPLVLSIALLGAHVDTVATALAVAALAALRWSGARGIVLAGAVAGLAATTKFTYAVVLLAIVLTWVVPRLGDATCEPPGAGGFGPSRCGRGIGLLLLGFLPTVAMLHAWTGPHVYDQISRARSSVSLASPWRLVLTALRPEVGNTSARSVVGLAAGLLAIALAVLVLRRVWAFDSSPAAAALVTTAGLATAYSLAAPYTLPWYDLLAWAALPALAPGLLDGVLLTRLAIMATAYVPGRVLGMTPEVESLTLGLRRSVAPWLQAVLWVVAIALLLRRADDRDASVRSRPTARQGS